MIAVESRVKARRGPAPQFPSQQGEAVTPRAAVVAVARFMASVASVRRSRGASLQTLQRVAGRPRLAASPGRRTSLRWRGGWSLLSLITSGLCDLEAATEEYLDKMIVFFFVSTLVVSRKGL